MKYKGYVAEIEYDPESEIFCGRVANIRDVITFHGRSVDELRQEFQASVDDYIEMCDELGEEPEKPFSGRFVVRMPPELHRQAALCAKKKGVSLNAWVVHAVREQASMENETLRARRVPPPRTETVMTLPQYRLAFSRFPRDVLDFVIPDLPQRDDNDQGRHVC